MLQVLWSEIAEKGLVRCVAPDRLEGVRKTIELKLGLSGAVALRRLPIFSERQIYVFTQFIGVAVLRGVVEINGTATIWHVGTQPADSCAKE